MEAAWIKKMKSPPTLVEVTQRRNEPTERLIKRFMRKVKKEKIIEMIKDRQYYEKPSTKRNRIKQRKRRISTE